MDIRTPAYKNSSLLAIGAGLLIISLGIMLGGGNALGYLHLPSFLLVLGGSFAAVFVHYPIEAIKESAISVRSALRGADRLPTERIRQLVDIARAAHRDGRVKVLEDQAQRADDTFFRFACECTADGVGADELKRILDTECRIAEDRWLHSVEVLEALGGYAPAFGLIGTVVGLIAMLETIGGGAMSGVALGPAMATALVTTMYGALSAHLVFLPLAGKLRLGGQRDRLYKGFVLETMVSIIREENPLMLEQRLSTYSRASAQVK